ncbi:hypothetical protein BC833DRAFT_621175 [Globomyces pollinis-pini]|nr:hypothetical protein BC833DRAFT_621175 [Globomyces pollinis-pini]
MNIKDGGNKSHRLDSIKQQQKRWIGEIQNERNSPNSQSQTPSQFYQKESEDIQSNKVSVQNWYGVTMNRETTPNNNIGLCRICFKTMIKPVMTIPCGHNFCDMCLQPLIQTQSQPPCPACYQPITSHILNNALEEILNQKQFQKEDQVELSTGFNSLKINQPDFDEDPNALALKYKNQLDQLEKRVSLLSNESDTIKQNIDLKKIQLKKTVQLLTDTTTEMKEIADLMERQKIRLRQLDELANENQPLVPKLHQEIGGLEEKLELVGGTLQVLVKRRDKVSVVWNGLKDL